MLAGTVTEFDADRGLGTVRSEAGDDYLFHVVEITDGSRSIDVGQTVVFEPRPRFGRYQAAHLRKV